MCKIVYIFACVVFKEIYYLRARINFTNTETIIAVMYATKLVVEIRPGKKFKPVRDLNP